MQTNFNSCFSEIFNNLIFCKNEPLRKHFSSALRENSENIINIEVLRITLSHLLVDINNILPNFQSEVEECCGKFLEKLFN